MSFYERTGPRAERIIIAIIAAKDVGRNVMSAAILSPRTARSSLCFRILHRRRIAFWTLLSSDPVCGHRRSDPVRSDLLGILHMPVGANMTCILNASLGCMLLVIGGPVAHNGIFIVRRFRKLWQFGIFGAISIFR